MILGDYQPLEGATDTKDRGERMRSKLFLERIPCLARS